jgi:4-amino-4-deoxy-L-arabinose transferase-like glycosyltransferase
MSQTVPPPVETELPPAKAPPRDRSIPWGWAVFALGLTTALFVAFVVFRLQGFIDKDIDPYGFGKMGETIAAGHWFQGAGNLLHRKAPLYPLVIGMIYALFGDHARLIFVLHAFYFAGTCVLAFDLGRRIFNRRTGFIAGVVCAVDPVMLRYVPSLHLETQLTFFVTLFVWLVVLFYEQPTLKRGVLVGLVAGAATLTKAVPLLLPVLFMIGIALSYRSARRRGEQRPTPWKPIVAVFLAMGCTILPWTIRNYHASHHVVLVSTGTSDAFLRGFIFTETPYITLQKPPYTDAENASNAYFIGLAEAAGTDWRNDDYGMDRLLNKEAKRRLIHEPGAVARKTAIGLLTFWYEMTDFKNSLVAFVLAVGAWALAIVGWRQARRERRPTWLLLLPVFYFNILLAFLLALGRYSVPILPALLVVSAFGVDTLLSRRASAAAPDLRSAST